MSIGRSDSEWPCEVGAAAGLLAWLVGYVLTYLLTATELDDSALNAFIQLAEGESATDELVGWVLYNAHFVDVRYENLAPFSPPLLLFAAGLAVGRYRGSADTAEGSPARWCSRATSCCRSPGCSSSR